MRGIFGIISNNKINKSEILQIVRHSQQRGKDSSGLFYLKNNTYLVDKANYDIVKLLKEIKPYGSNILLGHSRLITNGLSDNQPVIKDDIIVLHNGIIVNDKNLWSQINEKPELEIDTEIIIALVKKYLSENNQIEDIPQKTLDVCDGIVSCAVIFKKLGKILLFSNNGSLFVAQKGKTFYFASESYALKKINCKNIQQLKNEDTFIINIPKTDNDLIISDKKEVRFNLIPNLTYNIKEEKLLEYNRINLIRCRKCVLPETMPFIRFDSNGICNYCNNYKLRNVPKSKNELFKLVERYRRAGNELDCIVPFSGGRDSCYGLHLIVNELKMKPVTYTYDWGMVTDLGRRNISRMCSRLGVENIIVAADISTKRRNIKLNLEAWLKSPNLGMMAMLTAGDKHFFRYVEHIKNQTGIKLNLWGVNPLEVTHFKTGFLGIKPDFEEDKVYSNGIHKQIRYHSKRFIAMTESLGYFNSSLWDTLSGEYFRSFTKKEDYYHIFDFWRWDEDEVNNILLNTYDWETAIDTKSTWRIGDGTAAFYNYVYNTVAGFTEHDTFRSNQIREGQLTRETAIKLLEEENKPRYQNIRWYLDTLGFDFKNVIKIVNNIPKLYSQR